MIQKKKVGKSAVAISELVLGTWAMGGTYWGEADDRESIRTIHAAVDCGMNTLDTAEAYNNGYSEQVIGRAIQGRVHDVVISSKVANYHMAYDDLIASCERSLRNLGRDYIDLYFLHWPSHCFGHTPVPLEETLRALQDLLSAGKIRAVGLSNFEQEDFEHAGKHLRVDAYQPPYNMLWRRADDMLAYCRERDISIISYSSAAQGLLTGTIPPDYAFAEGDNRKNTPLFQPENRERAAALVEQIRPFAQRYNKTLTQLVLRWTMQVPGITAPIVGARTPGEVADNAGAAGWQLPAADFKAIDGISREFCDLLPNYRSYFDTGIVDAK